MFEMLRAFMAANLDVASVRRIAAAQKSLRGSGVSPGEGIAWVSPPNMHVTLRFFESMSLELAPALGDGMRLLVAETSPIRVGLGPLQAFPSVDRARIVLIALEESSHNDLTSMARKVEVLAQAFGFPEDPRTFHPHVALARLREATDVTEWFEDVGGLNLGEASLTDLALYRGEPAAPGREYPVLERVALPPSPSRSQRPPRGRRPSHRPRTKTRAAAPEIPSPPALPNVTAAPTPGADPEGSDAKPSLLPPAVEAALPPDEDWGD